MPPFLSKTSVLCRCWVPKNPHSTRSMCSLPIISHRPFLLFSKSGALHFLRVFFFLFFCSFVSFAIRNFMDGKTWDIKFYTENIEFFIGKCKPYCRGVSSPLALPRSWTRVKCTKSRTMHLLGSMAFGEGNFVVVVGMVEEELSEWRNGTFWFARYNIQSHSEMGPIRYCVTRTMVRWHPFASEAIKQFAELSGAPLWNYGLLALMAWHGYHYQRLIDLMASCYIKLNYLLEICSHTHTHTNIIDVLLYMLCDVIGDAYNIIERSYSHRNRSELNDTQFKFVSILIAVQWSLSSFHFKNCN